MAEPVAPVEDPLFLALTRPVMFFGVPIEATMLLAFTSTLVLMLSSNPLYAIAVGGVLFATARLIVRRDYNMFRLLMLFGRTKGQCVNRAFWGGSSYTPLPLGAIKRPWFPRG